MGRPSKFSKDLAESICARMIGGESIRAICKDDGMPNPATIFGWLAQAGHEFIEQYTRAREVQAEMMADEIMDIADDGTNDFMEREAKSGKVFITADHENINRSRLRVDARKWVAAKLLPKKYGDKPVVVVNAAPVLDIGNLPLPDARATRKPN